MPNKNKDAKLISSEKVDFEKLACLVVKKFHSTQISSQRSTQYQAEDVGGLTILKRIPTNKKQEF